MNERQIQNTPESIRPKEGQIQPMNIVSIDGRWCQVLYPQTAEKPSFVVWLDGKPGSRSWEIDMTKYRLEERIDRTLGDMRGEFTDEQIARFSAGPDQVQHPELRLNLKVFGKYTKAEPGQ